MDKYIVLITLFVIILLSTDYKQDLLESISISFLEIFYNISTSYPHKPAIKYKSDKKWITVTYIQYYNNCIAFRNSLLNTKLEHGSRIIIMGTNSQNGSIHLLVV